MQYNYRKSRTIIITFKKYMDEKCNLLKLCGLNLKYCIFYYFDGLINFRKVLRELRLGSIWMFQGRCNWDSSVHCI